MLANAKSVHETEFIQKRPFHFMLMDYTIFYEDLLIFYEDFLLQRIICQLSCCYTRENESNLPRPFVFTWPVFTNQISNLLRSNYKFSVHLRNKAPNKKLTCIHLEIVQLVGFVKRWSGVSQKSISFDSGIT